MFFSFFLFRFHISLASSYPVEGERGLIRTMKNPRGYSSAYGDTGYRIMEGSQVAVSGKMMSIIVPRAIAMTMIQQPT